MKPTHLLVDLENVQPEPDHLRTFLAESGSAWVFHSSHQKKLLPPLKAMGDRVTLVPTTRPGKNSLDFHLVFYLGYLASRNNHCQFVVLSQDKDYDPAIEHARVLGLDVSRRKTLANGKASTPTKNASPAKKANVVKKVSPPKAVQPIKAAKKPAATPPAKRKPDVFAKLVANLQANAKNRPAKRKTLERHIGNLLGTKGTPERIQDLVAALGRAGIVKIADNKIEYKISKPKKSA